MKYLFIKMKYLFRAFKYRYRTDNQEIRYMLKKLKTSDIAVDIGCHKGGYTYWMQKKIKKGKIYAFEPQSKLCTYLEKIIKIFDYKNVILENKALSSIAQKQNDFFIPITKQGSSPGASMKKLANKIPFKKSNITTTTLDAYFFENTIYPNFIKMDVEGFEKKILLGGIKLLKHTKPTIIMECENRLIDEGANIFDIFQILLHLGYNGFFYRKNKKLSIENFNPDIDQNFSEKTLKYKGNFVNNFIFEPNK